MLIDRGNIYWVTLDSDIPHPYVILQDNLFNHSRLPTVVACALTTNPKRVGLPGNVALEAGEAGLPKRSVVEAGKLTSLQKTQLGPYIGTLTEARVTEILDGIRFLQRITR
ncbi:type II toxin-antitoxin system PemK/MazF family toxin [Pseudanabaena sp. FACHB-2040]|uniref:type II toxin-antitoxin system PemK/MazF family toxin n=1 Tax=Pseudanabaena sp. FACHB-2040 TaxID=2692859 RepID=UPI00168849C3|nr:type II toxin-antitoxin system PemK/MazF family toxin [Pseudanabaena sp. FACHB-2040]MBD2257158.1 type II toxin-antitoxin system PemK/MazF family toxin [Pseudanabaena sp. FACHB-2040]